MARYRKGDRYLSEEEHREEENNNWIFWLFVFGAIMAGTAANKGLDGSDIPKWLRFTAVILSGLIGGGVLGLLYRQIQFLVGFSIIGGIIYLVGSWVWNSM